MGRTHRRQTLGAAAVNWLGRRLFGQRDKRKNWPAHYSPRIPWADIKPGDEFLMPWPPHYRDHERGRAQRLACTKVSRAKARHGGVWTTRAMPSGSRATKIIRVE